MCYSNQTDVVLFDGFSPCRMLAGCQRVSLTWCWQDVAICAAFHFSCLTLHVASMAQWGHHMMAWVFRREDPVHDRILSASSQCEINVMLHVHEWFSVFIRCVILNNSARCHAEPESWCLTLFRMFWFHSTSGSIANCPCMLALRRICPHTNGLVSWFGRDADNFLIMCIHVSSLLWNDSTMQLTQLALIWSHSMTFSLLHVACFHLGILPDVSAVRLKAFVWRLDHGRLCRVECQFQAQS